MSARSRPPRSLQAKALQLLAQREQSRAELRRKLAAHARAMDKAEADERARGVEVGGLSRGCRQIDDRAVSAVGASEESAITAASATVDTPSENVLTEPSVDARVEAVLTWLESHQFASDERFAESRVHARQGRFGNLRIRRELATHSVVMTAEVAATLQASELGRATDVCERKFAAAPIDRADAARQSRFLIARGFSPDVVRRVLQTRMKRVTTTAERGEHVDFEDA